MAATNINRVVLTGNLTRDPELRSLPSGMSVCTLRIASNTRRKDNATGEWEDKPNYFDVTVWGAQGENCARFLARAAPSPSTAAWSGASGRPGRATSARPSRSSPTPSSSSAAATTPVAAAAAASRRGPTSRSTSATSSRAGRDRRRPGAPADDDIPF